MFSLYDAVFLEKKMSFDIKLFCLKYRLEKLWARIIGSEKNVYVWDRLSLYREIWEKASKEISAQFIELTEGIWEIRYGKRLTRLQLHKVQLDDPVVLSLAGNKPFCYDLFEKNRLPVPRYICFTVNEAYKANQFMAQNEGFFVVKPAIGTSAGMGVTTHIESLRECRRAIALASLYSKKIIVECLIPGEAYRLLFLDGEMIHASRRRGFRIKGDGRSTIKQLTKNVNKYCAAHHHGWNISTRDYYITLHAQGLSCDSVPEAGKEILVKSCANFSNDNVELRTVYNEDVSDIICTDIREQAANAVNLLNTKFAGVDIITLDPTVSLDKSGGVINEINTTPGLHHHYELKCNKGENLPAILVLKHLLGIT